MATSVEMKIKILKKSMSTFGVWLDSCDQLIKELPQELENSDPSHLRELALKYKDLLLQMKERCAYMQEVNSLCKEVEQATSLEQAKPNDANTSHEGKKEDEKKENGKRQDTQTSAELDPKLIDLATEVKELNMRFSSTCLQAKDHYASLSKVLTASLSRRSSLCSLSSVTSSPQHGRSSRSKKNRKKNVSRQTSLGGEFNPKPHHSKYKKVTILNNKIMTLNSKDSSLESSLTSSNPNSSSTSLQSPSSRKQQGGVSTSEVSVPPTVSSPARLNRRVSWCASSDIDSDEVHSQPKYKVLLRSKSVNADEYSDTEPHGIRRRPRSAVIIQPNPDGDTAFLSEVELRGSGGARSGVSKRRSSMEINLSSLANIGILSPSNVNSSSPSSPAVGRLVNRYPLKSTMQAAGDRSSLISIESLDPRAVLTGHLHQNSHSFNMSIGSDITSSVMQIPDLVTERGRTGRRRGKESKNLVVENGLKNAKRSVSMDMLSVNRNQVVSLSSRLNEISLQLQDFIQKIAENRKCTLQSLELELHLGEMKAMSSLLEFHDLELTRFSASFSQAARDKLKLKEKSKRLSMTNKSTNPSYSDNEISNSREEIVKLDERVGFLRVHCDEAIEQIEEVLEFVTQYENEMKRFKGALDDHTSTLEEIKEEGDEFCEDSWTKLSEAFSNMTEQKTRLHTLSELSNHLLFLEPVFNGSCIRQELTQVKAKFQKVVLDLFSQLELQAMSWTDQLLLEMSVLESWVTEAELTVQALTKKSKKPNGITSKMTETRTNLLRETEKRKAGLKAVSEKLEPICLILKPESNRALRELMKQLENHSKSIELIEAGITGIVTSPKGSEKGHQDRGIFRSLYGGKKQDKVQDKRSIEDKKEVRNNATFQDEDNSSDENNPYAEIDGIRKQIFASRQTPTSASRQNHITGRPPSISGQTLNIPGFGMTSPPGQLGTYQCVEEVLPSPFMNYDVVPTRPLDVAIAHLPHHTHSSISSYEGTTPNTSPSHYSVPNRTHTAPEKLRYTEIDVSLYDNPRLRPVTSGSDEADRKEEVGGAGRNKRDSRARKHRATSSRRKNSPHEELLLFVGQEWKDLNIETTVSTDDKSLEKAINSIPDHEKKISSRKLAQSLKDLETQLKSVKEQVTVLKPPKVPNLEQVHATIKQCQTLRERLDRIHPQVESCNEQCFEMTSAMESSGSTSQVAQLLELYLFDVSTLWHVANMEVASCMKELRESESHINSLHRQLHTLSRMLTEARTLLEEKQNLLDVEEYLKKCETMHTKLIGKSDKRTKVATDIRDSILHDPQSPVCQELLDQLKELETEWLNVSKELSRMSSLETILIKRVLDNTSREETAMEQSLKVLEEERGGFEVDTAKENHRKCQECLLKAKQLDQSLTYIHKKLEVYAESAGDSKAKEQALSSESSAVELSGVRGTPTRGHAEDLPIKEVAPVDYDKMLRKCSTLEETAKRLLTEFDELYTVLVSEYKKIEKFHKVFEELNLWMTDTRSMLEVTGSSSNPGGMGVPASAAQLRGKHQAICQQVVARQPKMETLHSLASELIQFPAMVSEREALEQEISGLYTDWDELCQQCVPAGVLPLVTTPTGVGGSLAFKPPSDFEDAAQMVEWLILIESKMQPVILTVGDLTHLKKLLRDLHRIEKELKMREKDYKKFMNGKEVEITDLQDLDTESSLSTSNASIVAVNFSPSKSVKFDDENTLERNLRHQEIHSTIVESGESSMESSELDSSSTFKLPTILYHSVGPITGQRGKLDEQKLEPNLNSPASQSRILNRMSSDPECSLYRVINNKGSSPMSPLSQELYQLMLLWRGIWSSLLQERSKLEAIQERWRNFESKKEEFCKFLSKAEERTAFFLGVIGGTKNFGVIQTEMTAQKNFDNEVRVNEHRLSTLNNLSHELITQHHSNDNTQDLKEAVADLNLRWKKMMENYCQHQPTITALSTRWAEFYREYQSFEHCYHNLDVDMSNLNPFIGDMGSVKTQLEKLKMIQHELQSRDGALDNIRLLAMKLVQGMGGSHLNSEGIHSKLDIMAKRWKHLQSLAVDRKEALEQALTEKQGFLSHLADCLAWLNQAEKHLKTQKPLGSDLTAVTKQQEIHQGFWREVQEQQNKMELVISSGRQMTLERHWPPETAESLKTGYGGLESRWKWVWSEADDWGKLLEIVLPEMERFQTLCTDCGKILTDAEMTIDKFDTISRRIPTLKRQLEALQIFEKTIVNIGNSLGILVNSQKRQLELGVRKSMELFQLVKRYHQRWNALRGRIEKRHADIEAAMIKYDPQNLGVSALPRGWIRRVAENQVPYFIDTNCSSELQWHHPDLMSTYKQARADHNLPAYPSSAYPIALRLRAIQKRTQLSLLQTRQAMEAYDSHTHTFHPGRFMPHPLTPYETTVLAVDVFQKVEDEIEAGSGGNSPSRRGDDVSSSAKSKFFINAAVELTSCWLRDVFDEAHEGTVKCSSFILAVIALSSARLEEKYNALFKVISGGQNSIDIQQLIQFLEQMVQVPQLVCDDQFCSLHALDICAKECFKKFVGVGRLHLPQFISWLETEPLPLCWLPVLHRLAASESSIHEVKCGACKTTPIRGFRYRCIQCNSLDMCQTCYWSGKSAKGHDRGKHYMEEYCLAAKSSDEMRDFFKSFQRSFRRKKKATPEADPNKRISRELFEPTQIRGPEIDASIFRSPERKSKTWSTRGVSSNRANSIHGEENHPGRRFTVTEDLRSAWKREGGGGGGPGGGGVGKNIDPRMQGNHRFGGNMISRLAASSSMTINETGRGHLLRPNQNGSPDMEASFNKLKETTRNLSHHLKHMKERQFTSEAPAEAEEALKQRNSALQGRVHVLQEHNRRLETCIAQLKLIAEARQQQLPSIPPPPVHVTPHSSPLHTLSSTPNGIPPPRDHSTPLHMNHAPHLSNHHQPDHPPPESPRRLNSRNTSPSSSPARQRHLSQHQNESLSGSTGMLVPPARAGSGIPPPQIVAKQQNTRVERTLL